jgi:hypothetical protein
MTVYWYSDCSLFVMLKELSITTCFSNAFWRSFPMRNIEEIANCEDAVMTYKTEFRHHNQ